MFVFTFSSLVLLLLISCHVAEEHQKQVHKLNYQYGDWRPHFNYVPGHMAKDHKLRRKPIALAVGTRNLNVMPESDVPMNDYVVRLLIEKKKLCSGIVVGLQKVLTTTMCLYDVELQTIQVKLYDGSIHKVVKKFSAADYAMGTGAELVTLLILDKKLPMDFKKSPPICRSPVESGEKVELWTWDPRKVLLKQKIVNQIPDDKCKQMINDTQGTIVNPAINCLENTRVSKGCEMNYGLPYVWNGQFCGMNILGHNCQKPTSADVYVRLMRMKRFMSKKIKAVFSSRLESAIP